MNNTNLKECQTLFQDMVNNPKKKNFKYRKSPDNIIFIRANTDLIDTKCKNCGKTVYKNNAMQIVFFCGKKCRKVHKHRYGFRLVEGKEGI